MLISSPVCASATPKSRRSARRWLRSVTVERRGRTAANNGSSVGKPSASRMNAHHGNAMFAGRVQPTSSAATAGRRGQRAAQVVEHLPQADERHAAVAAAVFLRRRRRAARRSTAAAASRRAPSDAGAATRRRSARGSLRPLRRRRRGRRARRCLRTGRGSAACFPARGRRARLRKRRRRRCPCRRTSLRLTSPGRRRKPRRHTGRRRRRPRTRAETAWPPSSSGSEKATRGCRMA